jgi:hypothetical protein
LDNFDDLIAEAEVQCARLGITRQGLVCRLTLKAAGLPTWERMDEAGYRKAIAILRSAEPETGYLAVWMRVERMERALLAVLDGDTDAAPIKDIREEHRGTVRVATRAFLLDAARKIAAEFDGKIAD